MSFIRNALPALALVSLAACGRGGQQPPSQGASPPVEYVVVKEQPVTLTTELPGRTTAYETSDVRPQVNGIILARLFEEGDMVAKGQPLYRIDPAPYQAQVANARAALAKARAAIASSVVDMPTSVPPMMPAIRTSAGVS